MKVRRACHLGMSLVVTIALAACSAAQKPAAADGATPSGLAPTTGAGTGSGRATLTVFAAASLAEAFTQIGADFQAAQPEVQVNFNFAGSQQLAQQIAEGAPADVFASADQKQMNVAVASGRLAASSTAIFARNRLVVIVPTQGPQSPSSLQGLARPGIRLVIAAKEVPVGQYTLEFLDEASRDPAFGPGYEAAVVANVVSYEENVRSVLAKVVLGEADAGVVYTTDITSDSASKVREIPIPDRLNTVAEYVLAPLSDSPHLELARQFVAWVLSAKGQGVLSSYGFLKVGP